MRPSVHSLRWAELIPTRYSLLSRLQNREDQDSWKDFFDTYWRLIYSIAIKSGLSETEAQDVVQETVISVAKHIEKFKRDRELGSFKGWLRNIVRWRIADQLEKRTPSPGKDDSSFPNGRNALSNIENIPDPGAGVLENLWEAEWRDNLLQAAVQRVKGRVKEEHFLMFDLYVVRKWPVLKVARRLGVGAGQVYLVKHRISALIKKEIRILEQQPV